MKVEWTTCPIVPVEELERNVAFWRSLGLPYASPAASRPPLAVVGGGPSLPQHLEALRAWPGEIWACGSPWPFLKEHGIEAVFFNVDPLEETIELARGAKRGILSTTNHQGVYAAIEKIELFDIVSRADFMNHGATTATAAPHLALTMGYTDITFFACESSFVEQSHAYKHEDFEAVMRVVCADEAFWTKPALVMQAEFLASVIRLAPQVYKECSGGLLAAMVRHGIDYDITHMNKTLHAMVLGKKRIWIAKDDQRIQVDRFDLHAYAQRGWQLIDSDQPRPMQPMESANA